MFLWIIPIIFVLFLLLTAPESRAEDRTEAITEETDVLSDDTEVITEEVNVLSDGTITVYNNPRPQWTLFLLQRRGSDHSLLLSS